MGTEASFFYLHLVSAAKSMPLTTPAHRLVTQPLSDLEGPGLGEAADGVGTGLEPLAMTRRYGFALALVGVLAVLALAALLGSTYWEFSAADGRRWLVMVLVAILATLILEAIFVFRPMVTRAREDRDEMERSQRQLAYLAYHDSLTDLPNRLYFLERLTKAMEAARRGGHSLAVLQLDLDHFKDVNDTLGRAFGDHLLVAVKQRLAAIIEPGDSLARLTGDEFAVLRPCLTGGRPEATKLAGRICRTLSVPFQEQGTRVFSGATVGLALYPGDGESGEELLANCDLVLDHAKETNLGEVRFYEPSLRTAVEERKAIEAELRSALVRRELGVYYQPQVRLEDGAMVGVEALLRWDHPQRGILPVEEFLDVAEVTGLIEPIGESVLRQACAQMRQWLDAGLGNEGGRTGLLQMSVNLSAHQFRRDTLPEVIEGILRESGLPPQALEIEVTEGTVLSDSREGVYEILRRLHDLGVSIALDDFGTGFASLTHVNRWPIDRLKIDRSFVARMEDDPQEEAVVRLILSLAESLGLTVIAEGVETGRQEDLLRRLGCTLAQGFLFAPPLPAAEVEEWLRRASEQPEPLPPSAAGAFPDSCLDETAAG